MLIYVISFMVFILFWQFMFRFAAYYNEKSRNYNDGFLAGMATGLFGIVFGRDIVGQEGYIQLVQENWTSGWISVPIVIGATISIFLFMLLKKK